MPASNAPNRFMSHPDTVIQEWAKPLEGCCRPDDPVCGQLAIAFVAAAAISVR
jgi:hypothetical protein